MRTALLIACVLAAALPAASALAAAADQSAQRESVIETSATVESVDQQTREVLLRAPDGRTLAVMAGPEVRNLSELKAGDTVQVTY
jgi:Cu/Ag efflux protein CusF